MQNPLTCRQMWADFMRDKLDERAAKSKFVAQSRPALYYSQKQVEHARWELKSKQPSSEFLYRIYRRCLQLNRRYIGDKAFCFSYFGVLK